MLISATTPLIVFGRAELDGTAYLRPIRQLLEDVAKERITARNSASASAQPQPLSDQSKIDQDLQAIEVVQARFGDQLATGEQFGCITY